MTSRLIELFRRFIFEHQKKLIVPTNFFMKDNSIYDCYQIGEWTYGNPKILSWGEGSTLKIGKFCSISDEVTILLGGEHRTDWVSTYPFNKVINNANHFTGHPKTKGDVYIGNDVWIGYGAFILSGVNVHDGAVIGAKSVITGDVPAYSIVAGNPARTVRFRFSDEVIDKLLKIAWWNWSISKIQEVLPYVLSSDIDEFLKRFSAD